MSRTVLIVDEDVNAQIIAQTLLRLRGLDVRIALDAAEACDIVAHEDVAVVVLDLSLPGVNGNDFVRRLRSRAGALRGPGEPRIMVVTDRQEPEVERFARRLGAAAFLRKPFHPGRFIAAVEDLAATPLRREMLVAQES